MARVSCPSHPHCPCHLVCQRLVRHILCAVRSLILFFRYLSRFSYNWSEETAEFVDDWGSARIPLDQNYQIETGLWRFDIDITSSIEHYFRAPVMLEKDGSPRVFSDFRAVGQPTAVRITRLWRDASGAITDEWTIFDKTVSDFQAVEFAYEPPVNGKGWNWADSMSLDKPFTRATPPSSVVAKDEL